MFFMAVILSESGYHPAFKSLRILVFIFVLFIFSSAIYEIFDVSFDQDKRDDCKT